MFISHGRLKVLYCSLFTEPPSFQSKLENITILSSWESRLLCQAQRGPAPVITWFKTRDGISLQMLQNRTSVIYSYDPYLQLDEVECVASNSFGSDNKRLLVNTLGMSKVLHLFCVVLFLSHIHMYVSRWELNDDDDDGGDENLIFVH